MRREREREIERDKERERERERWREGARESGREICNCGTRVTSEGWAYGAPTPMFELSRRCFNASWWVVDSCMVKIGQQGMPARSLCPGNNQRRTGAGKRNPTV